MTLDKKITDLLEDQIPDYVQEYYPIFVIFITKYYEWLEQGGNPQEIVQNIQLNADIDTTASSLATKFVNTYAPNLPQTSALDRAVLVKNFRDFYRSKGSPKSFEFFFRAFFDDEIIISLPGDSLFRTSDGDWYVEKTLRVQAVTGDPKQLEHTTVRGSSSNATAIIEHAVNNYGQWDLTVQNRSLTGTFLSSETIVGTTWNFDTEVSSQIVVLNTQPVLVANGRQRGTRSQLSADQRIQDSVYWQRFSYVIKTRVTRDRWYNAVLEQLHPSGRNIFADVTVDIDTSVSVGIGADLSAFANTNQITTEINFATSDDFIIQPGYSFDRLANFKTGTSTTTSAGAVTYAADYTYGGENITFALQNAADNIRSYVESFTFTSITGTVSAAASTGNTALNRDTVSYTMPVTSITGTIGGVSQPTGGEMVITGTGTYFTTELPLGNVWRYYTGNTDAFNNPVYEFYSSVLTIENLPITGTVTLASQTPVSPNYYYYATGTNTKFLSDLLVTGGNTSTGVSNEINAPRIFPGERQPRVFINNIVMTKALSFTSGLLTVTNPEGKFLSETYVGADLTVIKQLSGRLTQVSSLPAIASSYAVSLTNRYHDYSGTSLSTVSSTASVRHQDTSNPTLTDPAAYGRWDIALPFAVNFLGTSVTKIYVHSTGMLAFDTSMPAHGIATTDGTGLYGPSSFQPAVPKIYINPAYYNRINRVYYQNFGVTPNRYFKVSVDGWKQYPYQVSIASDFAGVTSNVLTTGAGLTLSTTPTSGTLTNGYWIINLPWTFTYFNTSYNQIYVTHHGRISFGDWKDDSGNTITTNVTTTNGITYGIPALPRIDVFYLGTSQEDQVSPYYATQNNPRFGYGIWSGVHRGSAATTSRVFVIRWEGGVFSGSPNNRVMGWEIAFQENRISSVTINNALSPYMQQFVLGSRDMVFAPLWKLDNSGVPYKQMSYIYQYPVVDTSGNSLSIPGYQNSSYSAIVDTSEYVININLGEKQDWEATFYENTSISGVCSIGRISALGQIFWSRPNEVITGRSRSNAVSTPQFRTGVDYYLYWTDAQNKPKFATISNGHDVAITTLDSSGNAVLTYNYFQDFTQTALPAISSLLSTYSLSSSTSLLFRLANAENDIGNRNSYGTANTGYWSSLGILTDGGRGMLSATEVTSNGLIYRWPRDGFNATSSNTIPNPTCSSFAIVPFTVPAGGAMAAAMQSFGTSNTGTLGYATTSTINVAGYLFSYGSSVGTHGRWMMSVPTWGVFHAIKLNGYIGVNVNGYSNGLGTITTGNNLQLWYSTAENPTPPDPGQSPSTAGWTLLSTVWTAGASPNKSSGLMFAPNDAYTGRSINTAGLYAVGKSGYYNVTYSFGPEGRTTTLTFVGTAPAGFKCTWLLYQSGYTAQTVASDRLSEYLITEFNYKGYGTGYYSTYQNIIEYDPYTSQEGLVQGIGVYGSSYTARLRDEINSGSIIRISHPINRTGGVTDVDYVVSEDPKLRLNEGDYSLVLRATTSITNSGYTTIYDGNAGGYFNGMTAVVGRMVETRTVASISNNSTLTVTAPFTSTMVAGYWGNATSSSGTSARSYSLINVLDNNSMVLSANALDTSLAIITNNTGLTVTADRRFVLTGINTSSNMTISGGGVYANFTGKTATFPKRESGISTGFILSGYHNNSYLTANTLWATTGVPGFDNLGINRGNVAGTRIVIGNSSFSLVSVLSDTAILVTGSTILGNFYNTGLTMYFPSYSSNISVTGISTIFLPQITTGTTTSAGFSIEEVTEANRSATDFRYGFLKIGVTSYSIVSIINSTSLVVAGGPITETFANTSAISYVYRRDYPLPRSIAPPTSASFDKIGSTIGVDDSLVTQGNNVDFTNFRTLYHSSSYTLTLTANTVVLSTSIAVNAASSLVLLVTWMKDFADNAAEGNNRFTVSVSSAGTFLVSFDNEIQQNYKDVAVGQTLLYSNTFYVHSSNTISSTNVVNSGDTTSQVVWNWIPFNINRSGVYSRLSARFDSRADSSINISVSVPAGYQWNSTTSDFVNITVLGAA